MLPVVSVEGRIVADPELRFGATGTPVVSLRLVASSRKRNEQNQWVDDKQLWIDVTAFRQLAMNVAESLAKGDLVVVQGKLQTDEWEDRNSGEKRSKTVLLADSIGPSLVFRSAQLLDGVQTSGNSGTTVPAQRRPEDVPAETSPGGQQDEPPF